MQRRSILLSARRLFTLAAAGAAVVVATTVVAPQIALASNGRADMTFGVSPSSVVYGDTVTLSAEMVDNSGSCFYWRDCDTPQGTVYFYDNGFFVGSAVLAPGVINFTSFAEIEVTAQIVGFHHYTAYYRGDFDPTNSDTIPSIPKSQPDLTVAKAPCSLSLSVDPLSTVSGQELDPAIFTADLGTGGHVGTVDFLNEGGALYWRTTIGADGRTATFPFLAAQYPAGDYTFHAVYYGDANHLGCTSTSATHTKVPAEIHSGTVDLPKAQPDQFLVNVDTPIVADVMANDDQVLGYVVKPVITFPPSHGTATIDPDTLLLTYTPDAGYAGSDFLNYRLVDAETNINYNDVANVTFSVECRAPGQDDVYEVVRDVPLVVDPVGVLGNDQSCGGDATVEAEPAHGNVALGATGGFTYTPAAGFSGTDSFTYTLQHDPTETPVTVTLLVVDPTCTVSLGDDTYEADGALDVPAPGLVSNDELCGNAIDVAQPPAHGSVEIAPGGGFTYTPDAGYAGPDTFTYGIAAVPDDAPAQFAAAVSGSTATVNLTVVVQQETSTTTTTTTTTTTAPTATGTGTATTTTTTTTTTPSGAVLPPSNPTTTMPAGGAVLPSTGSGQLPIMLAALATVIGGAVLIRLTRRRPVP